MSVESESTGFGCRYTVTHTYTIEPTGEVCPQCGEVLWTHSDRGGKCTFVGMYDGAPIVQPHYAMLCDY